MRHITNPDEIPMMLCELRAKSGKSRRLVAELADVDANSLQQWEGGSIPKLGGLIKLLHFYGETVTFGAERKDR